MPNPDPQRVTELRAVIANFLKKRLNDKLDTLAPDDPKRTALHQQFIPATWLDDAARRVNQIQAVTHALKPIHPGVGDAFAGQPFPKIIHQVSSVEDRQRHQVQHAQAHADQGQEHQVLGESEAGRLAGR